MKTVNRIYHMNNVFIKSQIERDNSDKVKRLLIINEFAFLYQRTRIEP
jgi:hypothetical protein